MIKKNQHIYLHNDSQACRRTKEWSAAAQRLAPWLQQTRVTKSQSHDLLTSYLDKNRDGSPYRMMLQSQKHRLRVLVFSRVSGKCHQEAGAHTHSNTQTHTHTNPLHFSWTNPNLRLWRKQIISTVLPLQSKEEQKHPSTSLRRVFWQD